MNCTGVRSRGLDYFERRLSDETRNEVDEHLASCRACADLFALACETTCREFADACGELSDAEATSELRARLERHLTICKACREYLRSYQRSVELTRALATDASQPLASELAARILALRPLPSEKPPII